MTNRSRTKDGARPYSPWVFFYGSFINLDVLAGYDVAPVDVEVARLGGFDICIEPLATLIRHEDRYVYGILTRVTHAELDGLYGQEWVAAYRPEAVLVETLDGRLVPALCYIAPVVGGVAESGYIDRIVTPARTLGFPEWYISRIEGFRR